MITEILIEPVVGNFDVAQIAAHFADQPHAARDEVRADIFMLAETDEELATAREARRQDPTRFVTSVILVELGSERIEISCRTVHNVAARSFVKWLRRHYSLKFLDEEFNDLTPHVTDDLDFLFGEIRE